MPEPKSMRLGFVAGTIPEDKLNAFERLLFRATRGNMYLKWSSVGSVMDPTTTEKVEKAVFVVFFAGERARSKILKVCTVVHSLNIISNSTEYSVAMSCGASTHLGLGLAQMCQKVLCQKVQRMSDSHDVQICEAFSANRYPFPDDPSRQRQMNAEVTARLRELQTTIEAGVYPAQASTAKLPNHLPLSIDACPHRSDPVTCAFMTNLLLGKSHAFAASPL